MPTGGCEARKEATLHIRIGKVASFARMAGVEITSYTLSPICPLGDGMGRRRILVCYTNIIVRFADFVNSDLGMVRVFPFCDYASFAPSGLLNPRLCGIF